MGEGNSYEKGKAEEVISTKDGTSLNAKLPDLLGWKQWQVGDWLFGVEKDRTPVPGTVGSVEDAGSGNKFDIELNTGYNPVKYPDLTIAQHLQRRFHHPYIKSFLSEVGVNIMSFQHSMCADFEINAMECIEYYGAKQGIVACKDWYDDFIECVHKSKQNLRIKAMFKKRQIDNHLEYLQGKRTWDETYEAPPKAHAFVEPWHDQKFANLHKPEC